MKRLNITSILNQVQEESISKSDHPLWGLKDSKGWLTRYPVESIEKFKDTSVIQKYLWGGGSFDTHSVWGLSPYRTYKDEEVLSHFSAEKVGELVKGGWRIDHINSIIWKVRYLYNKGYNVFLSEDISPEDLKIFRRGLTRLEYFNPKTHPPVMSVGYWNKARFFHEFMKRWDWYPGEYEMERILEFISLEDVDRQKYPRFFSFFFTFQNYMEREKYKRNRNHFCFEYKGKKFHDWDYNNIYNKRNFVFHFKRVGEIYKGVMKKAHRLPNGLLTVLIPRNVYKYDHIAQETTLEKVDSIYYVFKEGDFVNSQSAINSLKEAVEKYLHYRG